MILESGSLYAIRRQGWVIGPERHDQDESVEAVKTPRFDKENMDTASILQELRRQRDQLAEAIIAFERLAAGAGPRRGRPPKWLAAAKEPGTAAPAEKPATKKRRASKKAK